MLTVKPSIPADTPRTALAAAGYMLDSLMLTRLIEAFALC